MFATKRTMTPKEVQDQDNTRAAVDRCRAIADYNIMMGLMEDPQEDVEEGETDE